MRIGILCLSSRGFVNVSSVSLETSTDLLCNSSCYVIAYGTCGGLDKGFCCLNVLSPPLVMWCHGLATKLLCIHSFLLRWMTRSFQRPSSSPCPLRIVPYVVLVKFIWRFYALTFTGLNTIFRANCFCK